jgi:hypothetical protein
MPVRHRVWAPWNCTSVICHASVLHIGMPSSCSSGHYNTIQFNMRREAEALSVIKQRIVMTAVSGCILRTGPWVGEPSNCGNEQWKTWGKGYLYIFNMHNVKYAARNMHNMQVTKICKICKLICKRICTIVRGNICNMHNLKLKQFAKYVKQ